MASKSHGESTRAASERERRALLARVEGSQVLIDVLAEMRDPQLLALALTHSSVVPVPGNYERLEFLGDSVLGLVVVETIFARFPQAPEGALARLKAALVSAETLSEVATEFGFFEAVRLGEMQRSQIERSRKNIGADVVESIIGAIYLDQGLDAARAFVHRVFGRRLSEVKLSVGTARDAKSSLHELVQGAFHDRPAYEVIHSEGPAHARRFHVEVRVLGYVCGSSWGPNRKAAEQGAAAEALQRIESGELSLEKLRPA